MGRRERFFKFIGKHKFYTDNKKTIHNVCDVVTFLWGVKIPHAGYRYIKEKIKEENYLKIIQKSEREQKYVLVGDQRSAVETYLKRQFNRLTIGNIWNGRRNISIVSLDNSTKFEALKVEQKDIILLACTTEKTGYTQTQFNLPKELPDNIKSRHVVIVNPKGHTTLTNCLTLLNESPDIKKFFNKTEVLTIFDKEGKIKPKDVVLLTIPVLIYLAVITLLYRRVYVKQYRRKT